MHNYESNSLIPVALIGARGYSGLEVARILLKHPNAELKACFAASPDFQLSDHLAGEKAAVVPVRPMSELDSTLAQVKVVFLATPAEVSLELAPRILAAGVHVIDLSGAFRLDSDATFQWYGLKAPELPCAPEYGLVPWAGPFMQSNEPRLISNPGCYATAILMALLPVLKKGLIDPGSVVIDAKSGTTGAGRRASESLLFSEVDGQCLPYKVGRHQHLPEIIRYASKFTGVAIQPFLATHLIPVRRGILASIYARTVGTSPIERIEFAFAKAYQDYPLLRWGRLEEGETQALSFRKVEGRARTEIRFELRGDQLYLFALIDNLMKGAASQAIENFNRIHDLPVTTALTELEGVL